MDTMKRCTVWLALVLAGCNSSSSKPTHDGAVADGAAVLDSHGVVLPDGAAVLDSHGAVLPDGAAVSDSRGVVVLPDGAAVLDVQGAPPDGAAVLDAQGAPPDGTPVSDVHGAVLPDGAAVLDVQGDIAADGTAVLDAYDDATPDGAAVLDAAEGDVAGMLTLSPLPPGQHAAPGTCALLNRVQLTDAPGAAATAPALVWTGVAYIVVWSDARNGTPDIYATWIAPDGSRIAGAADTMVAHTGLAAGSPRVAPFGAGQYLLVWENCETADPTCSAGTSVDKVIFDQTGQDVGAIASLTALAQVQRRPYVVSAFGGAYVTFRDLNGTTVDTQIVPLDATGAVKTGAITLGADSAGMYSFLTFANNQLALTYSHGLAPVDIVLDLLDASLTVTHEIVVRDDPTDATNPIVAWNGTGWTVAWEDQQTGDSQVRTSAVTADASAATAPQNLQDDEGNWPQIASDGTNSMIAFYGFPSVAAILLGRLDGTGRRIGGIMQISDDVDNAKFPAIAYNDQNQDFGVVWEDETAGEIFYGEVECR